MLVAVAVGLVSKAPMIASRQPNHVVLVVGESNNGHENMQPDFQGRRSVHRSRSRTYIHRYHITVGRYPSTVPLSSSIGIFTSLHPRTYIPVVWKLRRNSCSIRPLSTRRKPKDESVFTFENAMVCIVDFQ